MEKLLLDTDIGSDIDDAVCLAYLLAQPKCDLLGVTTVSGDTVERAKLASVLCRVSGKRVPVYPGVSKPLLIPEMQPKVPQARALKNWDHDKEYPEGKAAEFMAQVIRRHPHEVTLLAIGPLTNLALLFSQYPDTAGLLKELVIMGGVFGSGLQTNLAEWNIRCDPHAAAMVFQARIPRQRCVGLDVTFQVQMRGKEVKRRFKAPLLRPVADFAKAWFEKNGLMTFHDPLAATVIFDPKICTFEKGRVEVELQSPRLQSLTAFSRPQAASGRPEAAEARHEVAVTVDRARFFKHYFSVF